MAPLTGGTGGAGSSSIANGGGGGGGAGGFGAIVTGAGGSSNSSTVTAGGGGAGGSGNSNSVGGNGGDGGVGLQFTISGATFTNTGTITAGNGGAAGPAGGNGAGTAGAGGSGIVGSGLTIINSSTIAGGLGGDGVTRANAITFTGGPNILELRAGSAITGNVVAFSAADTFRLGGTTSASFDVSQIGASAQYRGFGVFEKAGTSVWTLTGTNTAALPWAINAGTLAVNSTLANSTMTVNSGGTLAGTGTVGAVTVNSGGTLAPGTSPGIINTGNLSLTSGSALEIELDGTMVGTHYDQVNVTGTVNLGGGNLDVGLGFVPPDGFSFIIINNDDADAVTGMFAGLPEGATFTVSGTQFRISYKGGDGNDVTLTSCMPILNCPSDIVVPNTTGMCGANVGFTAPTSSCGDASTCLPAPGTFFPVGMTTVNCTVMGGPSCSFTVTVNETTPPVIICPPNQTLSANANCQAVATYTATATDNCTASPTVMCTPPSGSTFNLGTTTVTCKATDAANNMATCTFTVTVQDTTPPTITCPGNVTKVNDPNQCGAVVTYPNPTVNDNCPGATSSCSPASGSFFPVGTTTVTCTAKDAANNMASCTFTVTVQDTQPPSITCPVNIIATGAATCPFSNNSGPVSFTVTASDNCPGVTVACKDQNNQAVAPGQPFPVGTTTVTCTATDASGNTATCSFSVTAFSFCLQDETNPGNVVLVDVANGKYRYCCNGVLVATGTGTANVRGCIATIDDSKGDRKVHIQVDTSANKGVAFIQKGENQKCFIQDNDLTNNTCQCQ